MLPILGELWALIMQDVMFTSQRTQSIISKLNKIQIPLELFRTSSRLIAISNEPVNLLFIYVLAIVI